MKKLYFFEEKRWVAKASPKVKRQVYKGDKLDAIGFIIFEKITVYNAWKRPARIKLVYKPYPDLDFLYLAL